MLFGNVETENNNELQSLKEMMKLLCQKDQGDVMLIEAGLRVLRAILYLNPGELSDAEQKQEYELMVQNHNPSDVADLKPRFLEIQEKIARLGAVEVVTKCLSHASKRVSFATLKLAVVLVHGGNEAVQNMFLLNLDDIVSQHFFEKLYALFEDAMAEIKESKRRLKRIVKTAAEFERAGIDSTAYDLNLEDHAEEAEYSTQKHMIEVMKMMRQPSHPFLFRFWRVFCQLFFGTVHYKAICCAQL